MAYLLLTILIVAVITIYISYKTPRDSQFDHIVLFFLFTIVFHTLYVFIYELFNLPKYIDTSFPFGLIYGPILYFALTAVAGKVVSIKKAVLHLGPFILWFFFFLIFAFSPNLRTVYYGTYHILLYSFVSLSMIGYVSTAFFLNRKRSQSESFYKTIRLITVGIPILATLGLLMLTLTFTHIIPRTTDNRQFPRVLIYTTMLIQVAAVLRHQIQRLFKERDIQNDTIKNLPPSQEVNVALYKKSLISESTMDLYEMRLEKLIKKDMVFQNMELSLEVLAKQIGAPKHHLTQLFNIRMKKNFNQYINQLRVQYACSKLKQNAKAYSIEELAYECGFNSKVSFNRNFKKITGYTPSEYQKQLKKDVSI